MNLIPWRSNETKVAEVEKDKEEDVVIYQGNPLASRPRGEAVQVRPKSLKIGGKTFSVDPRQLIRMIKQVTQTIGEYKDRDNPYASYVVGALRKARADMVSDLETHFNIHWEIDQHSGKCVFYM